VFVLAATRALAPKYVPRSGSPVRALIYGLLHYLCRRVIPWRTIQQWLIEF